MSEKITNAHILDHLRRLYDGQAVMNEALGVMKARLQVIEERLEDQAHNGLEDAQYSVALGEGLAELMEEVACLKKAIEVIEHHGKPPSRLN